MSRNNNSLSSEWLQSVASSNRVAALRPAVVNAILPSVEIHLRSVIEQAHKFTRRGKGVRMTVYDLNQALKNAGTEPLYGLVAPSSDANGDKTLEDKSSVSLMDIAKQPLPPCPLQPELSLHWLAVDGAQPQIPENPRLLDSTEQQEQLQLPKEMRQFYYRVTSILLRNDCEDKTCRVVLNTLRCDSGLQELLPHFSQFIQREVRANARSLRILRTLMSATDALWTNPHLSVEFHLQQMLPAAFTCVIAAKLCSSSYEDHWALRDQAAKSIAHVLRKFRSLFPDLQARVCRTYIDALAPDRALATVCGGIMGLTALGHGIIQALILPRICELMTRIDVARASPSSQAILLAAERTSDALLRAIGCSFSEKQKLGMKEGTWPSLLEAITPSPPVDVTTEDAVINGHNTKKRRVQTDKKMHTGHGEHYQEVLRTTGLEEGLVPYYAVNAKEASHLRMII